jgi:hypothetical protein
MDGRKVQHVEAEVAHIGQPGDDIVKGPVAAGVVGHRAREQFVPGAESGGPAVDDQVQLALVTRKVAANSHALQQRRSFLRQHPMQNRGFGLFGTQLLEQSGEGDAVSLVATVGLAKGPLQEHPSFPQFQPDWNSGGMLFRDLVAPGCKQIAPGDDREDVAGVVLQHDESAPAIVVEISHRRLAPLRLVRPADQ